MLLEKAREIERYYIEVSYYTTVGVHNITLVTIGQEISQSKILADAPL